MSTPGERADPSVGAGQVSGPRPPERQRAVLRLALTVSGLFLAGALAPALFMALGMLWAAITVRGSSGSVQEFIGLALMAMLIGSPPSIGVALIIGLPGIHLARRWNLTAPWVFGVAGAVLGLGCTAWFAHEDVASPPLTDWTEFAAIAALTGASCGVLCWRISER